MNGDESSFVIGEPTRFLVVTDPIHRLDFGISNLQAKAAFDAVVVIVA